jgi:hypothetical protein
VYQDAQLRKARPFEQMRRRCVVIVPTDEDLVARRQKQEDEGEKNIPDEALNEMKGYSSFYQCCGSAFIFDPDPDLAFFRLNTDPDPGF